MTLPSLNYSFATEKLVTDFETKPQIVDRLEEETGSRFVAMKILTETVASSFVEPESYLTPGQTSHVLHGWHRFLAGETSALFRELHLSPDGPQLSRDEANSVPELVTLQAIRRGVRAAANYQDRLARFQPPRRLRV